MKTKLQRFITKLLSLVLIVILAIPSQIFASGGRKKNTTYDGKTSIMGLASANPVADTLTTSPDKETYTSDISYEETDQYRIEKSATINREKGEISYKIVLRDKFNIEQDPSIDQEMLTTSFAVNSNSDHRDIIVDDVMQIDAEGNEFRSAKKVSRPNMIENTKHIQTVGIKTVKPQYGVVYYLTSRLDAEAKKDLDAREYRFALDMSVNDHAGYPIYEDRYALSLDTKNATGGLTIDQDGKVSDEADLVELAGKDKKFMTNGVYIEEINALINYVPATIKWSDYIFPQGKNQEFTYYFNLDENQDTTNTQIRLEFYEAQENGFVKNNSYTQFLPYSDYLNLMIPEGQFARVVFSTTVAKDKTVPYYTFNGKKIANLEYDLDGVGQAESKNDPEEDPLPETKPEEDPNTSGVVLNSYGLIEKLQNDDRYYKNTSYFVKNTVESLDNYNTDLINYDQLVEHMAISAGIYKIEQNLIEEVVTDLTNGLSEAKYENLANVDPAKLAAEVAESAATPTSAKANEKEEKPTEILSKEVKETSGIELNKDALVQKLENEGKLDQNTKYFIRAAITTLENYNSEVIDETQLLDILAINAGLYFIEEETIAQILDGLTQGLSEDKYGKIAKMDPAKLANLVHEAATTPSESVKTQTLDSASALDEDEVSEEELEVEGGAPILEDDVEVEEGLEVPEDIEVEGGAELFTDVEVDSGIDLTNVPPAKSKTGKAKAYSTSYATKEFRLVTNMKALAIPVWKIPAGWYFDVNIGPYLKPSDTNSIEPLRDERGNIVAKGKYYPATNTIRYTYDKAVYRNTDIAIDQNLDFDLDAIQNRNPIDINITVKPKNNPRQTMPTITVHSDYKLNEGIEVANIGVVESKFVTDRREYIEKIGTHISEDVGNNIRFSYVDDKPFMNTYELAYTDPDTNETSYFVLLRPEGLPEGDYDSLNSSKVTINLSSSSASIGAPEIYRVSSNQRSNVVEAFENKTINNLISSRVLGTNSGLVGVKNSNKQYTVTVPNSKFNNDEAYLIKVPAKDVKSDDPLRFGFKWETTSGNKYQIDNGSNWYTYTLQTSTGSNGPTQLETDDKYKADIDATVYPLGFKVNDSTILRPDGNARDLLAWCIHPGLPTPTSNNFESNGKVSIHNETEWNKFIADNSNLVQNTVTKEYNRIMKPETNMKVNGNRADKKMYQNLALFFYLQENGLLFSNTDSPETLFQGGSTTPKNPAEAAIAQAMIYRILDGNFEKKPSDSDWYTDGSENQFISTNGANRGGNYNVDNNAVTSLQNKMIKLRDSEGGIDKITNSTTIHIYLRPRIKGKSSGKYQSIMTGEIDKVASISYSFTKAGTNGPIKGAKFTLIKDGRVFESNKATGAVRVSDSNGNFSWNDLPNGSYEIHEIETPTGYIAPVNPVATFTVENGQTKNMMALSRSLDLESKTGSNTEIFNPVDEPRTSEFKLTKVNENDVNQILAGAQFSLVDVNDDMNVVQSTISNTSGRVYFYNIPNGTYYLREVRVPDAQQNLTFNKVRTGENIARITFEDGIYIVDSKGSLIDPYGTIKVPNPPDEDEPDKDTYNFELTKRNEKGEPLPGAEFVLIDPRSNAYIYPSSTRDNGTIFRWEGLDFNVLYTLRETRVPEGYAPAADRLVYRTKSNTSANIMDISLGEEITHGTDENSIEVIDPKIQVISNTDVDRDYNTYYGNTDWLEEANQDSISLTFDFKLGNNVSANDYFVIKDDYLTSHGLNLNEYNPPLIRDGEGKVIALGIHDKENNKIYYIFTDYVNKYQDVSGKVTFNDYIIDANKLVEPEQVNITHTIAGKPVSQELDVKYSHFRSHDDYPHYMNYTGVVYATDNYDKTMSTAVYLNPKDGYKGPDRDTVLILSLKDGGHEAPVSNIESVVLYEIPANVKSKYMTRSVNTNVKKSKDSTELSSQAKADGVRIIYPEVVTKGNEKYVVLPEGTENGWNQKGYIVDIKSKYVGRNDEKRLDYKWMTLSDKYVSGSNNVNVTDKQAWVNGYVGITVLDSTAEGQGNEIPKIPDPFTMDIANFPQRKGKFKINKVDDQGNVVTTGATFELRDEEGNYLGQGTTNSKGELYFDNLDPGIYYIKETKAPIGHEITKEEYRVIIGLDGEVIDIPQNITFTDDNKIDLSKDPNPSVLGPNGRVNLPADKKLDLTKLRDGVYEIIDSEGKKMFILVVNGQLEEISTEPISYVGSQDLTSEIVMAGIGSSKSTVKPKEDNSLVLSPTISLPSSAKAGDTFTLTVSDNVSLSDRTVSLTNSANQTVGQASVSGNNISVILTDNYPGGASNIYAVLNASINTNRANMTGNQTISIGTPNKSAATTVYVDYNDAKPVITYSSSITKETVSGNITDAKGNVIADVRATLSPKSGSNNGVTTDYELATTVTGRNLTETITQKSDVKGVDVLFLVDATSKQNGSAADTFNNNFEDLRNHIASEFPNGTGRINVVSYNESSAKTLNGWRNASNKSIANSTFKVDKSSSTKNPHYVNLRSTVEAEERNRNKDNKFIVVTVVNEINDIQKINPVQIKNIADESIVFVWADYNKDTNSSNNFVKYNYVDDYSKVYSEQSSNNAIKWNNFQPFKSYISNLSGTKSEITSSSIANGTRLNLDLNTTEFSNVSGSTSISLPELGNGSSRTYYNTVRLLNSETTGSRNVLGGLSIGDNYIYLNGPTVNITSSEQNRNQPQAQPSPSIFDSFRNIFGKIDNMALTNPFAPNVAYAAETRARISGPIISSDVNRSDEFKNVYSLRVANKKSRNKIVVNKTDSTTRLPIDNVEFTLTKKNDFDFKPVSKETNGGKVEFDGLATGEYILEETRYREGYVVENIKKEITINDSGIVATDIISTEVPTVDIVFVVENFGQYNANLVNQFNKNITNIKNELAKTYGDNARIAVVTYNKKASVYYDLTEVTNPNTNFTIPNNWNSYSGSVLYDGVSLASELLNNSDARGKYVAILESGYYNGFIDRTKNNLSMNLLTRNDAQLLTKTSGLTDSMLFLQENINTNNIYIGRGVNIVSGFDKVVKPASTWDGFDKLLSSVYTNSPVVVRKSNQPTAIGSNNEISVNIENTPNKIEFTKQFFESDGKTPVNGNFSIQLVDDLPQDANENTAYFKLNTPSGVDVIAFRRDNVFGWERLPKGRYTLEELAPKGFKHGTSITFIVRDDGQIEFGSNVSRSISHTIKNEKDITAKFRVQKLDENGKNLDKAKFVLIDENGNSHTPNDVANAIGLVEFTGLNPLKSYKLIEEEAPDGYIKLMHEWEVYVDEKGDVSITLDGKDKGSDFEVLYGDTLTINIQNIKPTYPSTGGNGVTIAFALIGTAVMLVGIAYFGIHTNNKNRRRSNRFNG